MNKLSQYIPGFRSNILWKKIIASVYYLFCLLTLVTGVDAFIFFTALPFVVFSFIDLIRYRKKGISFKRSVMPFILSLAIAIVGIAVLPSITENSTEPSQIVQETQESQSPEQSTSTAETEAEQEEIKPTEEENSTTEKKDDSLEPQEENSQSAIPANKELKIHFIDVGQADSILIETPTGESMLIDAGNNADADLVTSYIKNQDINKLDVVIGTHPHEDHIGGLDAIINTFDIEKVYMPKATNTTKTYEDVLIAIQNKRLNITAPTPGTTFNVGEAKCTVLAPNSSSYEDLNNYSIVIKMQYGNTSFLFTGDAEDVSEREILTKGFDLSADVLKVGHHGSSSSTIQAFLDAVNPKYAVIMVGNNNDYGHPHKETMDKLKSKNISVYRTDENGTIVAISDGSNITFNAQPGSYASKGSGSTSSSKGGTTSSNSSPKTTTSDSNKTSSGSSTTVVEPSTPNKNNADRIVYWTPKGKSYHYTKNCPTLSRSKTILSGPLAECPKSDPCDRCTR